MLRRGPISSRAIRLQRLCVRVSACALIHCTAPVDPATSDARESSDDSQGDTRAVTSSSSASNADSAASQTSSGADSSVPGESQLDSSESDESNDDPCRAGVVQPGPAPIRRLTELQYNRTLDAMFPELALPHYPLPKTPRVHGLDNDARQQTASALLIELYHNHATDIRQRLAGALGSWWPCALESADPSSAGACGRRLIEIQGPRFHRRPLSAGQIASYTAFFEAQLAEQDLPHAVLSLVQVWLQVPEFVYMYEPEGDRNGQTNRPIALADHSLAQRLAYFLWNSMPDDELSAAADAGQLSEVEQLRAQAERMLEDPRARAAAVEFHRQWFELSALEVAQPDREAHPHFSESLRAAMAEEFARRVEHAIFAGPGTVDQLFIGRTSFVNRELAAHYGLPDPAIDWAAIELPAHERSGLLTSAAFATAHAQSVQPSPVQRGLFVLRRLLCIDLPDPPADVDTSLPDSDMQGTNRARYESHLSAPSCVGCHQLIDPIGFSFEHYDATGRYRQTDAGWPVDAGVSVQLPDFSGDFADAIELSDALADHPQVHACLIRHLASYALGRVVQDDARDPDFENDSACILSRLRDDFATHGGQLRQLWLDLAVSDAFRHRRQNP